MQCQDVLLSGPLYGHHGSCRISLLQQVRSRGGARSLCRRRLLPRAETGEGGSSTPGLVSKPSLSRPPQRAAPAPESQGKGAPAQDKPARQGSGGAYRRQDSFQEGSAGNGEAWQLHFKIDYNLSERETNSVRCCDVLSSLRAWMGPLLGSCRLLHISLTTPLQYGKPPPTRVTSWQFDAARE